MSCIYKYKGKDYTKDEFYSLVRTTMVQPRTVQKYEKVLFPTGNTASKIEGHTTLEEFKKEKEGRIKQLETVTYKKFNSKQEAVDFRNIGSNEYIYSIPYQENNIWQIASVDNVKEIEILKEELKRVEGPEGFGALKPIWNFYENTVTNILNKTYGKNNVKLITDEYGNTWNEIITPKINNIFLSKKSNPKKENTKKTTNLINKLNDFFIKHSIKLDAVDSLKEKYGIDALAVANITENIIEYINNKEGYNQIPEEIAHFIIEILGKDHPYVRNALELVKSHPIYQDVLEEYKGIYKTELEFQKEALGQLLKDNLLNKSNDKSPLYKWITAILNAFKRITNKLIGNGYKNDLNDILDNIAGSALDNNLDPNSSATGTFYSTPVKSKDTFIAEGALNVLNNRLKQLKNKDGDNPTINKRKESLKDTISKMVKGLEDAEIKLVINLFIDELTKDITILYNEKETGVLQKKSNSLNKIETDNMLRFIETYKELINDTLSLFEDRDFKDEYKGEHNILIELKKDFDIIDRLKNKYINDNFEDIINENKLSNTDISEILDNVQKDVSLWRYFGGSIRNASNEILRISAYIADKALKLTQQHTNNYSSDIIRLREDFIKAGFKESDLLDYDKNDNAVGYISEYKWSEYNFVKKEFKAKLAIKLGLENIENIDPNLLSKEKLKIYNAEWVKFYRENTVVNSENLNIPHPKYKNDKFGSKYNNPAYKALYDKIIAQRVEDLKKLPSQYATIENVYKLPQIRKNFLDVYKTRSGAKGLLEDLIKVTEDDTEFGNSALHDYTGKKIRLVPIYFLNNLENPDNLATDIIYGSIAFTEMAENYKQMSKISSEFNIIREFLKSRKFKSGKTLKTGQESTTLKVFDNLLDNIVYGVGSEKLVVPGTNIDITKSVQSLNSYFRLNNLGFSLFTALSGYGKSSIDSVIETAEGVHTSVKSRLDAELEYGKNAAMALTEAGKAYKTNKMQLVFEYFNIFEDAKRRYRNLNINTRAERFVLSEDFWYSPFVIVDHRVKGKSTLAMLYNFKYVDGKWMNYYDYKKIHPNNKELWEQSTNLYDEISVENNKVKFSNLVDENTKLKIMITIDSINNKITGQLDKVDKNYLHRQVLGQAVLTHRNWLLSGVDARLKSKGFSYATMKEEEGYYVTITSYMVGLIKHNIKKLKKEATTFDKMTDLQKRAFRRSVADLAFIALLIGVSNLLYMHFADDDDYNKDFLIYVMYRIRLEQVAFSSNELLNILKSPLAAVNQLNNISDFTYGIIDGSEIVERGPYEGMSKRQRAFVKMLPGIRQYWQLKDPESKTNYLKASFF